ncbi:hypothetical protein [Rubrobacter calidifluminis]|uniref:hypothetical protein n=1 Tax=Rubrobacter calidifluminis TaxID=1392640 RepID=UPI00235F79D5|nr:hypothetical protein [Rubrobacter calidifluminis]
MAQRLAKAQRIEYARKAAELSAKGWMSKDIAVELGVSAATVQRLIDYAYELERDRWVNGKEEAIAQYRAIIDEAWKRLRTLDSRSLNVSGLLNSIRAAQERIDRLQGNEAPIKTHNEHHNYTHKSEDERKERYERLFAELDAYRLGVDDADGRGAGGESVHPRSADD